jgi:hypothetical protein
MPLPAPVPSFTNAGVEGTGALSAAADVVRGAAVGVSTLGVILVLALVVGIVLLFRRRGRSRTATHTTSRAASRLAPSNASLGIEELTLRAGAILVQVDDAVEAAENEVGFAVAQFGSARTREFADAVAGARAQVVEAFRLKQQLDDAYPDTDQQRRDWTKQVIALGESAARTIDEHTQQFTALRRSEADSPARLQALRSGIEQTQALLPASRALQERLASRYDPSLIHDIRDSVDVAERTLADAHIRVENIAARVDPGGVSAVSAELDATASRVHDAQRLLATLDETAASLAEAETALANLGVAHRACLS